MKRNKSKLKAGDLVKVRTGKFRGLVDYISWLDRQRHIVYLKKATRKKYDKSTTESRKKNQLKEIMVPLHISNVSYWNEEENC